MEYIYAALLLHKLGKEINESNLKKVIEAAGVQVDESKVKTLIASVKGVDVNKALEEAAMPVAVAPAHEKKEEKAEKHEEKKEAIAEGLSALFG